MSDDKKALSLEDLNKLHTECEGDLLHSFKNCIKGLSHGLTQSDKIEVMLRTVSSFACNAVIELQRSLENPSQAPIEHLFATVSGRYTMNVCNLLNAYWDNQVKQEVEKVSKPRTDEQNAA